MGTSRKRAWDRAEALLARPARSLPVVLRHGKGGLTVLHQGRALTRCYPSVNGLAASLFVAEALGVDLPLLGGSATAEVSTGVLYRALSIASLDLRVKGALGLARRLVEEAEFQRAIQSTGHE